MTRVALLGAGRIAEVHARGIKLAGAELAGVFDIRLDFANRVASQFSAAVYPSLEAALNDRSVDAVAIATSTDTHADLIVAAARAGKAVFCEKPIDLSVARAEDCKRKISDINPFIQLGFNQRFDPTFRKVAETVRDGGVGKLRNLTIISRDPAPAPIEYFKVSGGIFKDMTIHNFDMARFVLPEEPVSIYATGSVLIDKRIGEIGDVDTTTIVMKTASGVLCQIMNSRHCSYGFDQRMEAFGSEGAVRAENPRVDEIRLYTSQMTDSHSRLPDFFLERYTESYNREWISFFKHLSEGAPPAVGFEDGMKALKIAEAANRSLASGSMVEI